MSKILYEPVLRMKDGFGKKDSLGNNEHFTVNGARSENYDEAIRLASKHVSISNKEAEIIRVDEIETY